MSLIKTYLLTHVIHFQILTFMLDNASNNDTFVDGIEYHAKKAGVPFNALWACLHCMLHTIHLAAIMVCFLMSFTFVSLQFP
jgi:hypothetical protein